MTKETTTSRLTLAVSLIGVAAVNIAILAICGFDPAVAGGVLMANVFATPTHVMRQVAVRLVNNAVFGGRDNCNRTLDSQFVDRGVKMGDTIQVRLPQRFQVTTGAKMTPTPLTDQTVSVTISDQTNVGFEYGSWAATLEVQDYMERYAMPAVDALVNNIDYTGLSRMYKKVAKYVGTPGVVPGSTGTLPQAAMQTYVDGVTKLINAAVPRPYIAMLTPEMHGYLVTGTSELFNPSAQVAQHFKEGQFQAKALGVDRWYMNQNVATHTVGALGTTPLINGPNQTGTSFTIDGATASVTGYFLDGDVIQFASVFEINPLSHDSKAALKDFVVDGDTNSDSNGDITVTVAPSLIVANSSEWATASASPADNAAVTTFGHASSYASTATPQGLVYNKEAFVLAMADLVLPGGLWVSERIRNPKLGVSVRMLKDSDIINDVHPCRLDTAHGWAAVRENLACRIAS